jgi:outer membrane murein-binding lipoprotein Lpp
MYSSGRPTFDSRAATMCVGRGPWTLAAGVSNARRAGVQGTGGGPVRPPVRSRFDEGSAPIGNTFDGGTRMKKLLLLAVIAAIALAGCASGKFLGFLATTDYVDAKSRDLETKAKAQDAEIADLKSQLADYQSMKAQAQAAIDQMNKSQQAIQDLQDAAQKVEARINSLPREVIRQIVDILQASMGQ